MPGNGSMAVSLQNKMADSESVPWDGVNENRLRDQRYWQCREGDATAATVSAACRLKTRLPPLANRVRSDPEPRGQAIRQLKAQPCYMFKRLSDPTLQPDLSGNLEPVAPDLSKATVNGSGPVAAISVAQWLPRQPRKKKVPGLSPTWILFCVEFACSPLVHVGFL